MPIDDDTPSGPQRILRGRRRGLGAGSSTRSESLRTSAEADEIDTVLDPEQAHDRIVREVRTRPIPTSAPPLPPPARTPRNEGDIRDPRDRMEQVALAGSEAYSREYRLSVIGRMLMRRIPLDQIAAELGVSISTIEKDRAAWKQRLRENARQMDINEIIGTQSAVYDELGGMSLRVATSADTPVAMRLAAMRTTLAAEADRTRFLNTAGVFDVLRYRKSEDGTDVSDVQLLMGRTDEMLQRLLEEPAAPARPARVNRTPPRRTGGFAPLTMDDRNASSGDAETVDL